jgi:hypothetical protein
MSDRQVIDLLDRVTGDITSTPSTVPAGVARGRRRRRRHLVGTAAASMAVLALVGGGASLLVGGGTDSTGRVADPGPTTASADPAPSEPAPIRGPRQFGPDPGKTGWVLGSLLDGDVTRERSWHARPGETDDFRGGSVLLDGAQVTILLERTTLPRCGEQPPGAACDTVGDGFMSSATYAEPASGGGSTGVVTNTVTLFTGDHFAITATAYNAASEKDSAPFLDRPVLGVAELTEIVQDPVWLEEHQ